MKRQESQVAALQHERHKRILVFDIIRILCIAIIVYVHSRFFYIPAINQFFFPDGYGPFNIYASGLQGYAVYGLILVSGAVLEYQYTGIGKLTGYLQFLFRRFIRLYPAFWMSLLFSFLLFPLLWQDHLPAVLFEFTGFFVILGRGPGILNPMGWFIAAIFSLYILFPWFSKITRKYGLTAIIGFCFISWGLRSLILTGNPGPAELFWRWFPLCNAFEFCLGIFIVQAGLYPASGQSSALVRNLSDLSYYVFVLHLLVLGIFIVYFDKLLRAIDHALAFNNQLLGFTFYYCQAMLAILVGSWIIMKIDIRFRTWVLGKDAFRVFLQNDKIQ
jgi:peptidoglycan/LPS O-acetylase OafA/YrhL